MLSGQGPSSPATPRPTNTPSQRGEKESPSAASSPRPPQRLFNALKRSGAIDATRSRTEVAIEAAPQTVRQRILNRDRRSTQPSQHPAGLPVLNASPSGTSCLPPSPDTSQSVKPTEKTQTASRLAVSAFPQPPLVPPVTADTRQHIVKAETPLGGAPPLSRASMGVGSSDCQRESPVRSPSGESRLTSPTGALETATPTPSLNSPATPGARLSVPRSLPRLQTASDNATNRGVGAPTTSLPPTTEPTVPRHTVSPSPQPGLMDSTSPRAVPETAAASPTANPDERALPVPANAEAEAWCFTAPPDNQRTFSFPEDNNLEFSSQFDSGNLIQVERLGPYRYQLYTAMDCGNCPRQTNNRQWFHFSVRGGVKGAVLSCTVVGMAHSTMFTFDWMPVVAVVPSRPQYTRLPGKATVVTLDVMPETPGYPLLVYKDPAAATATAGAATDSGNGLEAASDDDNGSGDDDGDESAASPTTTAPTSSNGIPLPSGAKKKKKKKKAKGQAMTLSFEYRLEAENPPVGPFAVGHPLCAAIYIASNHPYSYTTLQSNIQTWKTHAVGRLLTTPAGGGESPSRGTPRSGSGSPVTAEAAGITLAGLGVEANPDSRAVHTPRNASSVYFHHEILCRSLEGRHVDLLTITDMHGMQEGRMPLICEEDALPVSSAEGLTVRPRQFTGKQYVVLTSRVHPGECPGSHMMHGAIEFLMNPKDPRAMALRQRFVFFLILMLNPDGVVRGHSRVDADGVDLNRMYKAPTLQRHPSPYCVRKLTFPLANSKRLALFIDMHAHANRKGTFFYGNAMPAADQVQNMLFAKLVSLNTPYLDFTGCNFSESNMFAVGRGGKGKDSSSRIVLFLETGFVHSYVIETSHVCAKGFNGITPLPGIPGEDTAPTMASGSILSGGPRHTPDTFGDTGKACLLALLDLKGINPVSRLPATPFQSTKGTALWLQRQLQVEVAEKLFAVAYKLHGRVEPKDATQTPTAAVLVSLSPDEFPEKVAFRSRSLPFCTVQGVADFVTLEECVALLAQTPATGLPRSLFGKSGRQRTSSSSPAKNDVPVTIALPKKRKASRSPSSPAVAQ